MPLVAPKLFESMKLTFCLNCPLVSAAHCRHSCELYLFVIGHDHRKKHSSSYNNTHKGTFNKYVRMKIGLFDPPSPLYAKWRHCYYIALFTEYAFGWPPLPPSRRTYLLDAPLKHIVIPAPSAAVGLIEVVAKGFKFWQVRILVRPVVFLTVS